MKQLGNLALVCARKDIVMVEIGGRVYVRYERGIESETLSADWDDDDAIDDIIHTINFGKEEAA